MSTVEHDVKEEDPEETERQQRPAQKPLLSQCFNLHDFEAVAKRVVKKTTWGYYSSAAEDEMVNNNPLLLPTLLSCFNAESVERTDIGNCTDQC